MDVQKQREQFPAGGQSSKAVDELVQELWALNRQVEAKYGKEQAELPYEEWVIWRTIMARVSQLSPDEQHYFWQSLRNKKPTRSSRTEMNWGPYRELEEIGRGGMGVVYKARDSRDGRTLAVKTIQYLASTDQQARLALVREAGLMARLKHPNIATVFDVGRQEGFLFIAMEYLEGDPLNRAMQKREALTFSRRLEVIRQTCMALQHAHEHGIVHRDVKPGNIFVLQDGSVKVLDFGISAICQIRSSAEPAGTPSYMSPEQITGAEVDYKSDIWSVGVTLFELLRGRLPFVAGTRAALFAQILTAECPATPAALPFSRELDRVFCRALAKKPENRYSSANSLAADLEKLIPAVEKCEDEILGGSNDKRVSLNEVTLDTLASANSQAPNLAPEPLHIDTQGSRPQENQGISTNVGLHRGYPSRYTPPALGFLHSLSKNIRLSKTGNPKHVQRAIVILMVVFLAAAGYPLYRTYIREAWQVSIFLLYALYLGLMKSTEAWVKNPSCPGCLLPTHLCSEWLNYPKFQTEDADMERECLSALESGVWEEAAKLFTVLGKIYPEGPNTSLRYKLTFHECVVCSEHAARMALYTQSFRTPLWRTLFAFWTSIGTNEETWDQKSATNIVRAGLGNFRPQNVLTSLANRILSPFKSSY